MLTPHAVASLLGESVDEPGYHARALNLLSATVDADTIGWVTLDMRRHRATVFGLGSVTRDQGFATRLAGAHSTDPVLRSYAADRTDLVPRRMSDLASDLEWRSTRSYNEAFRDIGGKRLLSIVLELNEWPYGFGWMFVRSGSDFTDDEVHTAQELQPLLTSMEKVARRFESVDPTLAGAPRLTTKEREVLHLLATGASARQIADRLTVSVRTVHKHLEHVYEKLHCADRLTAVAAARTARLI